MKVEYILHLPGCMHCEEYDVIEDLGWDGKSDLNRFLDENLSDWQEEIIWSEWCLMED